MVNRVHRVFVLFLFVLVFVACKETSSQNQTGLLSQDSSVHSDTTINNTYPYWNDELVVYDEEKNEVSRFECAGIPILTNDGVVYSKHVNNGNRKNTKLEFYHYIRGENKSVYIDSVEDVFYEASYATFFAEDHVYMLLTTNQFDDYEKAENYLVDIDLTIHGLQTVRLRNATVPYNYMTKCDDKIYIGLPGDPETLFYSYDIDTGFVQELKNLYFNTKQGVPDPIRHISANGDYVYLYRLHKLSETEYDAYLDTCDKNLKLISSLNITENLVSKITSEDPRAEIRHMVAHFDIVNEYIYYENFSSSRLLLSLTQDNIRLTDNEVFDQIDMPTTQIYRAWQSEKPGDKQLFYQIGTNNMYILDTLRKQVKQVSLSGGDDSYTSYFSMQNRENNAVVMQEEKGSDATKPRVYRMFWVNIDELSS